MSAPGPDPAAPGAGSSLGPLLHTLGDPAAPPGELTDAHLTIVSRLTGEGGKAFAADVRKHFPQLCKVFKAHISSPNLELSNAALQALGFCTFNSNNTAELSATEIQDLLSAVNSVAVKSSDKNTRTRALWVISKQAFPPEIVKKEVSSILSTLETILTKGDVQSVVVEYEALNVIIRLMEQTPAQMGEEAVRWAKLIIPLVVHSAHKVQLRGATALEMGMPLLLQKQQEVAAVTEHLMTTKLISELQKLFSTKNETFVLKLWPLFVRLLGKTLHRSGSFINSLLQLEELGFRSGSPVVKKIAFIAWKSLIDNFALNPDILCSAKRLKLLMQPLSSIHVRTEALALTKLEVWWYLLVRLGPHLPSNFEQVCIPLIQSTLSVDPAAAFPGTPSRLPSNPSLGSATPGQKSGTPRMALNTSTAGVVLFPSIQLLGIEMLLHFLMGPHVVDFAKQNKLVLSLEPLQYPLISSPSFFCKHASTLINAVQDGFIAVGKEVPDCLLNVIWKDINGYVKTAIEAGNKKEKQGSEILTMLLQALKNTVRSNSLPVQKILSLIDITVKELPPKVLGSPAYQVADMDLLNGTPALFLIQLPFHNNLLECCVTDERFFVILETLVGYVLSGPTSALAFSESVICVIDQSAKQVGNKEHLWRMWSIVVNPLTEWINQTNEVNQGDALEHNFSAVYSALLLPVSHIFPAQGFPQPTLKSLLRTWSDLYRAFARCAALVATAEENLCCEEICAKIISGLEGETPMFFMLEGLTHLVSVMVDCINFAPYGTKFQPKTRSPQTPTDWAKKKKEPLGKLASLFKLLLMLLNSFHEFSSKETHSESLISVGPSLLAALHTIISHISLPSLIGTTFAIFSKPLAVFYEKTKLPEVPKVYSNLNSKLEKLLAEILQCLQCHCPGSCDTELLQQLCPVLCVGFQHRNKQIRHQCAQLWNSTFAKTSSLTYPEELKSVLSQAKKKIPLLLPGFESIEMSEECSGPFSDTVNILLTPTGISWELLKETSIGEGLDTSSEEAASQEASAGKENTSNVSNSSASSDIISGTPQPVSRRQSFITLEKFGAAENRPFSPAPLNSVLELSGSAAGAQENTSGSKASAKAEKSGEENKNPPTPEADAGVTAIRRVTRRQSRMELQGNKSKLLSRSEESLASDSLESSAELCFSQALHSAEADIKKAEDTIAEVEKAQALDMDSKENTPPDTTSCSEQAPGDDSQVPQVSPHQKQLRRSSRRRSETVESSSGSQEKEDGLPKRDRRKEEEKAGQKKLSQGKGDGSQKQKGIPGKTTEITKEGSQPERVAEDWSSKDSPASRGLDEDGSRGGRRAEDSPRAEGEAQASLSTAGQKVVERPRYHTRRSSQGLLSSIENSEADSSEAKEGSTKKKKHIKVRSRSNSLEVTAEPGGLEIQVIPAAAGKAVGSGSSESPSALQDTSLEQNKGDASMESLSSSCVSDQDGRAAEENQQEEKQTSTGDCAPAASVSGAEPSSLQSPECPSKRSKRVKKIKSCDCCFKKPKQQVTEFKFMELKKEKTELEEPQTTPVETPVNVSGHSDLEESLALAPCAMSTPLHPPKEPSTFSMESQGISVDNLQGSSVVVEENPEGSAGETTDSIEEIKEPAELKEETEQVLPESAPGEPRESCLDSRDQGEEPAAAEKEEINENGQLEEVPQELNADSKPEEKEMKELEGNQEDKGEAENTAGETCGVADEEVKEEPLETEIKVAENVALENMSVDSPLKVEGDPSVQVTESPTSLQARCTWSPSASPSTSILKRGVKRNQEDDSLSPANKIRRVSFANPIFQEGLADDIDRRSPVIRSHSSPSSRSLKTLSNMQHITTPTKGFLSPGSRTLKFKSSKKCLITEMAKESLPCPSEFVYPALAGCKAPVDVILPQITSNICARGLGQLIRAKNIKTVGDLSTLTALEIKTLPIRSPKVSNVKRALKGYHEQQVKSRVLEESTVPEDAEKPGNNVEEKSLCGDEEKLAADLVDAATTNSSEQPPADLLGQIQALAAQLSSEDLHGYSGRQLFEMQEKLAGMASCILRNLQSRWQSPPHEGPE
uniref:Replication timing regulatory factor 1 n=1 Tax=Corvus moneduloides TaxID=1196302 RepID=A0A8C3EKX3_CORMO